MPSQAVRTRSSSARFQGPRTRNIWSSQAPATSFRNPTARSWLASSRTSSLPTLRKVAEGATHLRRRRLASAARRAPRRRGRGRGRSALALLVEECGRAVAPFGIFAALAGGLALTKLGTASQRKTWLPRVATGDAVVTLAVAEKDAVDDPAAFGTVVRRRPGKVRVTGEKGVEDVELRVD